MPSLNPIISRLQSKGPWVLLLMVLVASTVIRLTVLKFGLPLLLFEDEPVYFRNALAWLGGDGIGTYFKKPPFFILSYGTLYWLYYQWVSQATSWSSFVQGFWLDPTPVVTWGRALTVVFSTATVAMVYHLARKLAPQAPRILAIVAAALFAFDTTHLQNSTSVISDIPSLFFILLTARLALSLLQNPSQRNYVITACAAAMALSFKYNIFVFILYGVAHLWATAQAKHSPSEAVNEGNTSTYWKQVLLSKGFWVGLASAMALFFVLNWPVVQYFSSFWGDIQHERAHMLYREVDDPTEQWVPFYAARRIFFKILPKALGWPWYVACGITLLILALISVRNKKNLLPPWSTFLSFPLLFLLVTCQFQTMNAKYLMPLYPFLSIIIPLGLWQGYTTFLQGKFPKPLLVSALITIVTLSCAWPMVQKTGEWIDQTLAGDTRLTTLQVLKQTMAEKDTVASEPETVPMHRRYGVAFGFVSQWQGNPRLGQWKTIGRYTPPQHATGWGSFLAKHSKDLPTVIVMNPRPKHHRPKADGPKIPVLRYTPAYYHWLAKHYELVAWVHPKSGVRWFNHANLPSPDIWIPFYEQGIEPAQWEESSLSINSSLVQKKTEQTGPILLVLKRKAT